MDDRRLTDPQISAALRAHLPAHAQAGLPARVIEAVETTPQQRPWPSFLGALVDADPVGRRRSLLIAATLLVVAALAATVAVAGAWRLLQRESVPLPGRAASNGLIAVSANMIGDIYIVEAGTAPRRIAGTDDDGISQECPVFSTDGRMLAYGEARVIDPGANVRGRHGPVTDPAVVVVGIDERGQASSPIVREALGSAGAIACPEWSPTGTRLAFRVGSELRVVDVASNQVSVVPVSEAPAGQQGFEWSRDGSMIAVAELGRIRVVRLDGRPATILPVSGATPSSLGWAAGDETIVYLVSDGQGDTSEMRAVRVDGSADVALTRDPTVPRSTYDPALGAVASIVPSITNAVFSPDGRRVSYVSHDSFCTSDSCDGNDPEHLLTSDVDGSNVVEVPIPTGFGVTGLHWSPDGERLLLSSIAGVVAVSVGAGGPPVVDLGQDAAIDLEWSAKQVSWQPTFP